ADGFDLGNILPVGLSAAQLTGDLSLKFQIKGDGPDAASTQNFLELKPADLIVHPANISRYIGSSGDWYDQTKWESGSIPIYSDAVFITATSGATVQVELSTGTRPIQG